MQNFPPRKLMLYQKKKKKKKKAYEINNWFNNSLQKHRTPTNIYNGAFCENI